jgi:subtilisin family serine protease
MARDPTSTEERLSFGGGDLSTAPLDLVKLVSLMEVTAGNSEIVVGLIDGPVAMNHPHLSAAHIRHVTGHSRGGTCSEVGPACTHGTFVAGILVANRDSPAPAICPECNLLIRPIFSETTGHDQLPSVTPEDLASSIVDMAEAGIRVLNISAALALPSSRSEPQIEHALDYAQARGVITVAAAGNQGTVGGTAITRHPSVISVAAYDLRGKPMNCTNLGQSIGRRGLGAPGEGVVSLNATNQGHTFQGTSVAAPFVTGTIALLWSEFPQLKAPDLILAITGPSRRKAVSPPLLDAWAAYQALAARHGDRRGV